MNFEAVERGENDSSGWKDEDEVELMLTSIFVCQPKRKTAKVKLGRGRRRMTEYK